MNIRYPIYEGVYRILTNKQTSQPSHILFFDKCVIRFIVQQKYEKL